MKDDYRPPFSTSNTITDMMRKTHSTGGMWVKHEFGAVVGRWKEKTKVFGEKFVPVSHGPILKPQGPAWV